MRVKFSQGRRGGGKNPRLGRIQRQHTNLCLYKMRNEGIFLRLHFLLLFFFSSKTAKWFFLTFPSLAKLRSRFFASAFVQKKPGTNVTFLRAFRTGKCHFTFHTCLMHITLTRTHLLFRGNVEFTQTSAARSAFSFLPRSGNTNQTLCVGHSLAVTSPKWTARSQTHSRGVWSILFVRFAPRRSLDSTDRRGAEGGEAYFFSERARSFEILLFSSRERRRATERCRRDISNSSYLLGSTRMIIQKWSMSSF